MLLCHLAIRIINIIFIASAERRHEQRRIVSSYLNFSILLVAYPRRDVTYKKKKKKKKLKGEKEFLRLKRDDWDEEMGEY